MPAPRTRVHTLTFDFWNTLYSADDRSWQLVGPERRRILRAMLEAAGARPTDEEIEQKYQAGFEEYMRAWTSGLHFGAVEEVDFFLREFHVPPASVDGDLRYRTVRRIEEAARLGSPPLVPGVVATVPRLAEAGYKMGVISDTSLTPGRVLKEFMEADGLLQYFSVLTFSDETGYSKPDSRMFLRTLSGLGAGPAAAAHIGDTPRTDIKGAQSVGMIAIRCASVTDYPDLPQADFVIRDHRELPRLLEELR